MNFTIEHEREEDCLRDCPVRTVRSLDAQIIVSQETL